MLILNLEPLNKSHRQRLRALWLKYASAGSPALVLFVETIAEGLAMQVNELSFNPPTIDLTPVEVQVLLNFICEKRDEFAKIKSPAAEHFQEVALYLVDARDKRSKNAKDLEALFYSDGSEHNAEWTAD